MIWYGLSSGVQIEGRNVTWYRNLSHLLSAGVLGTCGNMNKVSEIVYSFLVRLWNRGSEVLVELKDFSPEPSQYVCIPWNVVCSREWSTPLKGADHKLRHFNGYYMYTVSLLILESGLNVSVCHTNNWHDSMCGRAESAPPHYPRFSYMPTLASATVPHRYS